MLFWAKKNTNCFVAIKSDFVVGSTVTTIFKRHCSTLILELNTYIYHQQTSDYSQPYFPQCITPWLSPAGLRD